LPMAQAFADLLIASSDDISASLEMSVNQSVGTKTVA